MISELLGALRAGEQLKDSKSWKNAQLTAGAVSALIGALLVVLPMAGVTIDISAEQVAGIAGGVAAVLGIFNSYTTVATTTKIGVKDDPAPIEPTFIP